MISDNIEIDLLEKISLPYVFFKQDTLFQKKTLTKYVMSLNNEEILLFTTFSFSVSAIIAGLNEEQIEYIAKNAPKDYKMQVFSSISQEYKIKEILEIAKYMDDDFGDNIIENQNRVKKVLKYIRDNKIVFQF